MQCGSIFENHKDPQKTPLAKNNFQFYPKQKVERKRKTQKSLVRKSVHCLMRKKKLRKRTQVRHNIRVIKNKR